MKILEYGAELAAKIAAEHETHLRYTLLKLDQASRIADRDILHAVRHAMRDTSYQARLNRLSLKD